MKRHIFTLFFILNAIGFSFAQEAYEMRQAMDFFRTNKLLSGDWKGTLAESDIQGSPYLIDEFTNGNVYTINKEKFIDIPLRYNIYNDEMEFKTPEDEIRAMAQPESIETIEFGEYKMIYAPYTNIKKVQQGFFKIELEGKASLYSRAQVMFKEAEEPAAYKDPVPARFVKNPDIFYIRIGETEAVRVTNKNELPDIFPDHKNEIASFIKKNKIKTNSVEKLQELVQYFNSL